MRSDQPTLVSARTWPCQGPVRLAVSDCVQHTRHSFKVMHDELYTLKVRISPAWARWVGEKSWHARWNCTDRWKPAWRLGNARLVPIPPARGHQRPALLVGGGRRDQARGGAGKPEFMRDGGSMRSLHHRIFWLDKWPSIGMIDLGVAPRPTRRKASGGVIFLGGLP